MRTIRREPDGHGTIVIRRGKTDQEGRGMVRYLAADTMRVLHDWLEVSRVQEGRCFGRSARAVLSAGHSIPATSRPGVQADGQGGWDRAGGRGRDQRA